mgnify:FL=1
MKRILLLLSVSSLLLAQSPAQLFQQALLKENGEGDPASAVAIYEKITGDETAGRALRAKAQLQIGICWEKMGKSEAILAYKKVVNCYADYTDQVRAAQQALARLEIVTSANPSGISLQKITSDIFSGHMGGYISPSGRYIIYGSEGGLSIYDSVTNEKRQFTDGLVDVLGSWSPDENYFAFARYQSGVFVKSLDGQQPIQLSSGPEDYPVMWNSRGEIYYYSPSIDTTRFYRTNIEGGKPVLVKVFSGKEPLPADVTSDLSYFVYCNTPENRGITLFDTQTLQHKTITADSGFTQARFSLNSKYLAAGSKVGSDKAVHVFTTGIGGDEIKGPVKIIGSPALKYSWSWTRNDELSFGQRTGFEQLQVCDPQGQPVNPLAGFQSDEKYPSWSPDDQTVVFSSDVASKDQLWLANAVGGQVTQLTAIDDKAISHIWPSWSQDGSEIVYVRVYHTSDYFSQQIWAIDLPTQKHKQVSDYEGRFASLVYSPDGTRLYFSYTSPAQRHIPDHSIPGVRPGNNALVELALTDKSIRILAQDSLFQFEPFGFTPDASKMLFQKSNYESQSSIWCYSAQGVQQKIISSDTSYLMINGITPDSKFLHVSTWNQKSELEFLTVSIEDGTMRQDTFQKKELWPLRWSHDNQRILCKKDNQITEFWLARNITAAFK